MSLNDKSNPKHTAPIAIPSARGRARSASISSSSSGSFTCSSPENPITPSSSVGRISIPSPSTSPILSYFLSHSPTKSPSTGNTFPFRKFGTSPVFEEEDFDKGPPVALHARRASATIATRFTQPPSSFVATEAHTERGTNLLRRLSLGAPAFTQPHADQKVKPPSPPPPNSAITPRSDPIPVNKPRRSATISTSPRPRRAPSPMGERILKGHFDGFN